MKYLVKSEKVSNKTLYVADTHSFNLQGEQLTTLTDVKDFAQDFDLNEAVEFIKKNPSFDVEENTSEYLDEEDVIDE